MGLIGSNVFDRNGKFDLVGAGFDALFAASLAIPVAMTYFLVDHMAAAGVAAIMLFIHVVM